MWKTVITHRFNITIAQHVVPIFSALASSRTLHKRLPRLLEADGSVGLISCGSGLKPAKDMGNIGQGMENI